MAHMSEAAAGVAALQFRATRSSLCLVFLRLPYPLCNRDLPCTARTLAYSPSTKAHLSEAVAGMAHMSEAAAGMAHMSEAAAGVAALQFRATRSSLCLVFLRLPYPLCNRDLPCTPRTTYHSLSTKAHLSEAAAGVAACPSQDTILIWQLDCIHHLHS